MKILVVEDEPDLNHIIVKHLKAEGYIVDSCFNGNDAVYYITEESYDAILLDAMLPGKDGFEVLKDIRSQKIETPSSIGIAIIFDIIVSTSVRLTLAPFMVASKSIVVLASRQM